MVAQRARERVFIRACWKTGGLMASGPLRLHVVLPRLHLRLGPPEVVFLGAAFSRHRQRAVLVFVSPKIAITAYIAMALVMRRVRIV